MRCRIITGAWLTELRANAACLRYRVFPERRRTA